MEIVEAENVKQRLERIIKEQSIEGLNNIEVFVGPESSPEFKAFQKVWRNSTYVSALTTFAHAKMEVYVCDKNYENNSNEFESYSDFLKRTGLPNL